MAKGASQNPPSGGDKKITKKVKVELVLNELRGIAGKDYSAGTVLLKGEITIPGMTVDDLNRGFAIKQIVAQ